MLKLIRFDILFVCLLLASLGIICLYSAAKGWQPWAAAQVIRVGIGFLVSIAFGLISLRWWYQYAYVLYGVCLVGLFGVELYGAFVKGAQRWLSVGFGLRIQPSELMKIVLPLALSRYLHTHSIVTTPLRTLFSVGILLGIPVILVLKQPDLGTALLLIFSSLGLIFVVGLSYSLIGLGSGMLCIICPLLYQSLHSYQKKRLLTFLFPETDPLDAGYHILQSQIAFGAGGIMGKGFMQGTQSHLNFLPEKHTDFIFALLCEEWGFLGGSVALCLYIILLLIAYRIALKCRVRFGQILGLSIVWSLFLYMFMNMAMVMGMLPVVGIPLPFISYGGTSLLMLFGLIGLLLSIDRSRYRWRT